MSIPRFHALSHVLLADDPGASGGAQPPAADPAAVVDVQAAIREALAKQQAEFAQQFKAATGHDSLTAFQEAEARRKGEEGKLLEARSAELAQARAELDRERTRAAILSAAVDAVDPGTVLALLADKAKVDGTTVVIDGLPPVEAVKKLLAEKPFLAKAGPAGSGAPQNAAGAEKNPWAKATLNLTEQIRISKEDPALAQKLKTQAGAA